MKQILSIALALIVLTSCKNSGSEFSEARVFLEVKKDDYELIKPFSDVDQVLVLFGGYPERIADVKREFKITDISKEHGVSILFMNYNQKLWLEEGEKEDLAQRIQKIFHEN